MTLRRVLLTVATAAAPAGVPDRAQDHIAHAGADHEQHEVEHPKEDDIEEDFYKSMPRRDVTDIVTTFMEALENSGYYAMIYRLEVQG